MANAVPMAKRTAIVTGARGQLGTDLVRVLAGMGWQVYGPGREELDFTDPDAVEREFARIRPDAVIHAGAYTAVDAAEEDYGGAFLVNAFGTRNIALEAERYGAKLVYVSTDYVFDGTGSEPYGEYDRTSPGNVYGESKLAGEKFALRLSSRTFVVRTSWVYGLGGGNFVKTMLKLAETRDTISVVNDQIGSPTYTVDLAVCIARLLETERYGIYHAAGGGQCSWYEFAQAIFRRAGLNVWLKPVTTAEFPRPARRPAYSVLGQAELAEAGLPPMRGWEDALDAFFQEREHALAPRYSKLG